MPLLFTVVQAVITTLRLFALHVFSYFLKKNKPNSTFSWYIASSVYVFSSIILLNLCKWWIRLMLGRGSRRQILLKFVHFGIFIEVSIECGFSSYWLFRYSRVVLNYRAFTQANLLLLVGHVDCRLEPLWICSSHFWRGCLSQCFEHICHRCFSQSPAR